MDGLDQFVAVDVRDHPRAGGRRVIEFACDHRSDHRPDAETVARAHKVQRRAHQRDANRRTILDQRREVVRLEPGDAGPQRDVRRFRDLRLDADEMLDRVEDPDPDALLQRLALEQRAIESSGSEDGQRVDANDAIRDVSPRCLDRARARAVRFLRRRRELVVPSGRDRCERDAHEAMSGDEDDRPERRTDHTGDAEQVGLRPEHVSHRTAEDRTTHAEREQHEQIRLVHARDHREPNERNERTNQEPYDPVSHGSPCFLSAAPSIYRAGQAGCCHP
jgi:hypothetical protein